MLREAALRLAKPCVRMRRALGTLGKRFGMEKYPSQNQHDIFFATQR